MTSDRLVSVRPGFNFGTAAFFIGVCLSVIACLLWEAMAPVSKAKNPIKGPQLGLLPAVYLDHENMGYSADVCSVVELNYVLYSFSNKSTWILNSKDISARNCNPLSLPFAQVQQADESTAGFFAQRRREFRNTFECLKKKTAFEIASQIADKKSVIVSLNLTLAPLSSDLVKPQDLVCLDLPVKFFVAQISHPFAEYSEIDFVQADVIKSTSSSGTRVIEFTLGASSFKSSNYQVMVGSRAVSLKSFSLKNLRSALMYPAKLLMRAKMIVFVVAFTSLFLLYVVTTRLLEACSRIVGCFKKMGGCCRQNKHANRIGTNHQYSLIEPEIKGLARRVQEDHHLGSHRASPTKSSETRQDETEDSFERSTGKDKDD